jgi:hypothetical protein
MLNALQEKIKVAVYPNVTAKHFKEVDIFDIYESIKTSYQKETLAILQKFADDILNGFQDKGEYQAAKKKTLQTVVFSGCHDRSKDAKKTASHSGRINFDIDENTKEELAAFLAIVKEGKIPFIEAAALSASGKISKSFWLNIKADIPSKFTAVLPELVKILHLTKDNFKAALHTAFYEMFADMLLQEGIKAGKSKDFTRARYLTFDPDIYINPNAKRLTLNNLLAHLRTKTEKQQEEEFEAASDDIIQSDAFLFAEEFAKRKTDYQTDFHSNHYTSGLHNYIFHLSVGLNCLGISEKEAEAYIQKVYPSYIQTGRDAIKYPYKAYKSSFGQWQHKLKIIVPDDYSLTLAAGERISNKKEELTAIFKAESAVSERVYLDLSSGTGSGKSYFAAIDLPSILKQLNGLKTVIVFPLNSKTEKDAKQYGIPFITGEHLKKTKGKAMYQALKSDVILTNTHSFELIAEKIGQKINVIIDESHTLPNSMTAGYKPAETLKMWEAAKRFSKVLILMSGTQKKYFNLIGFKKIAVTQTERPKIRLTVKIKEGKKTELAVLNFIRSNKPSDGQKLLIKVQSKEAIERIYKLLLAERFSSDNIVKLYSCPKIKKSKAYKRLINSGSQEESFDKDVKIILCTNFINEGLDIYSSADIIAVSFLKHHTVDVDDEVQFFDRWRTNKEKSVFLVMPGEEKECLKCSGTGKAKDKKKAEAEADKNNTTVEEELEKIEAETCSKCSGTGKPPKYKDYSLYLFKEGIQAAQKEADRLNDQKEIKSPLKPIFSVQTQYSSYEKTLIYSDADSKIIVNELHLMHEAEKTRKASTGKKEALAEIADRFKYFDIIDDIESAVSDVCDADTETRLEAIKTEEDAAKIELQQMLQTYLADNMTVKKEGLIQAIAEHTEDVGIKKQAKKRITIEAKSDSLTLDTKIIEETSQAEKLVKRVFRLEKMFFSDDDILNKLFKKSGEFISDSALNGITNKYKILLHLYLYEHYKDKLTRQQAADAKRLFSAKEILSDVKASTGEKMSPDVIYKALKPIFKKSLTARKAIRLTNILFNTTRSDGDYLIKSERTFDCFLTEEGLDSNRIFEAINSRLCQ